MRDLLLQSIPMTNDLPNWVHLLGGITSIAFIAWYAWYSTTIIIPRIQERNDEVIDKLVAEFRAEIKEQRDADRERARVSAELARSGHAAVHEITRAVEALESAIQSNGLHVKDDLPRGRRE